MYFVPNAHNRILHTPIAIYSYTSLFGFCVIMLWFTNFVAFGFIEGFVYLDVAVPGSHPNLTFRGPCIVMYSYNKTDEVH
jgi:hypothetical protein